jgi:hypothetical protein
MRKLFLIAFATLVLPATLASQARTFGEGGSPPRCPQRNLWKLQIECVDFLSTDITQQERGIIRGESTPRAEQP